MKDINYYKGLRYKLLLEYDDVDGVFYARFPELPGCMADGKTEHEALDAALRVKDEWLVATYEAGWEIPEPSVREETPGRVTLRMPKYLHRRVINRADEEGVSQNQLILAFIAQGLDKSTIEDAFKKIATTQDEIIKLLENNSSSGNIKVGSTIHHGLAGSSYISQLSALEPYSISWQSLGANLAGNIVTDVCGEATMATYPFLGGRMKQKEGISLVKPRILDEATEQDSNYEGGYRDEAKSGA